MIVRERRGRNRILAHGVPLCAAVVLLFSPPLAVPQASSDETAKRLWNATVTYREDGLVKRDRTGKNWRKWRKEASAQYRLTTYERAEQGFTWENANVSYGDKFHEHEESLEGAMDTTWDVSGGFTVKSIDDQAHQAEEAARRGQSHVRGAVFGGLVLHRQGDQVMALETPGIVVNAFHPGAKTIRTKERTRREDVRVSIGHSPDQALTREQRERRQKEMEQALKPQVDEMVKKQTKVIDEQQALIEKYQALAEKFKHGVPKDMPPVKPGQQELTPEMAAYLEQILGSVPPEMEAAGERVAELEQSQEALIVATLEQGGGKKFTGNAMTGSRQWGATEEERLWAGLDGSVTISRTLSWNFVPSPEEVEAVLIAQEDYEQWMPRGWTDEDTAANKLDVRVVLQSKGQKGVPPPHTAKFKFELLEVSKEKGVCLNAPPKHKAKDSYDLKIDAKDNPTLQIAKDGLGAETKNFSRDAGVTIATYDWGAYGKLRVTATLDNGRPVVAHWEKKPGQTELTIPLDTNGNRVADHWEKHYKLFDRNLPADWDGAEFPKGQRTNGDGISLYEKYRGFVFATDHERLHPNHKYLFIYDKTGLVAWVASDPALAPISFGSVSGLRLRIIDDDGWTGAGSSSAKNRIVNFNHGWGHATDQHGLTVEQFDYPGAIILSKGDLLMINGIANPDTEWLYSPHGTFSISIYVPNIIESIWNRAQHSACRIEHGGKSCQSEADWEKAAQAVSDYIARHPEEYRERFKKAIAQVLSHELGHGVGVMHHEPASNGDRRCVMRYFAWEDCRPDPKDLFNLRCYNPWPHMLARDTAKPCGARGCWQSVVVSDREGKKLGQR